MAPDKTEKHEEGEEGGSESKRESNKKPAVKGGGERTEWRVY